jgi:hypothetical protein
MANRFLDSINVYKYGLREKAWVFGSNEPACNVGDYSADGQLSDGQLYTFSNIHQQQYLELPEARH